MVIIIVPLMWTEYILKYYFPALIAYNTANESIVRNKKSENYSPIPEQSSSFR